MRKLMCAVAAILCVVLLAANGMAAEQEKLQLKYDDRKALTELVGAAEQVAISNEVVTSFKVGTQTPDDHVLHYDPATGTLYAVGVGTATLTVDGKAYAVEVESAVLSLIMYTGHSVGHGACGDGRQSVVVEAGQAYSIYDPRYVDFTQTEGYGLGWGSEKRVSNAYQYVTSNGNNHIDAFAPGQNGNRGAGSALAWQWNNLTGEKLWVLNTAVGGSCLNEWMPNASWHSAAYSDYYNTAVKMYTYAQTIMKNEFAAGHYTLGHMGLLYYCGANDKYYPAWTQQSIEANYETLWNCFTRDLTTDLDGDGVAEGPEYMGLVPYWVVSLREKLNFDKGSAQVMASGKDYPHMFIASNMLREFMWDENLSNFPAINYTTQSLAVTLPESAGYVEGKVCVMADDKSHPTQVAYNAIGIDTANNIYARRSGADTTITELTLIDENFNELSDGLEIKVGEPFPVAPWFEPFYADDLSYAVSGNAELIYPLQLVGTAPGTATLTVSQNGSVIKTLTVNVVAGHGTHCVCGGTLEGVAAQKHGACAEGTNWIPLDTKWKRDHEYEKTAGTNQFEKVLTPGNYYLESDFSWSGSIYIAPGETVNICLNGHTLTTTSRSFHVNGTLNICDCKGVGQVYSKYNYDAPVAYVGCCGAWNVYGGSMSAVESVVDANKNGREFGGIVCVGTDQFLCDLTAHSADGSTRKGGTLRLYDGQFNGSELTCGEGGSAGAAGNGGCVNLRTGDSAFYMYGGTLSGGKSLLGATGVSGANYGGGIIGSIGNMELWGGTICGSTDVEAAIYVRGGTLAIKGDVTFKNNAVADISVADGKSFSLEAAQSGSIVVGAKVADNGNAVATATQALYACLKAKEGQSIYLQNEKVYVSASSHAHCVCGGKLTGVAAQKHGSCTPITNWVELDTAYLKDHTYAKSATANATVKVLSGGNYYLQEDMTWSGTIYVAPGETVNICLNGNKLTTSSRSFSINGTLNICDCQGSGQVYSKYTGDVPVAYVCCCGTWNVYGGSYSSVAPVAREYGGVTCVGGSRGICDYSHTETATTIRLYAGVFNGCELTCTDGTAAAAGNGGCVNLRAATSSFYMYGGTLSGGKSLQGVISGSSADYGGGIIGSAGIVELWGGTIEGSTDNRAAVYGRSGSVSIKGNVTFKNNGKADIAIHPSYPVKLEAAQSGNIVFNMLSPGTKNHAIVADYDKIGCVKTVANYTALWQNGKVYIVKNADVAGLHTHCYCGGKAANVGDHVCTTMPVLYTAWTDSTKLPTSGTYYLDVGVQTTVQQDITSAELHLCLNGKHSTTTAKTFNLKGAKVDLCDCNATEGSITSSYNGGNALVSTNIVGVTTGSEFNLYGGKLIHSGTAGTASGVDSAAVNIKGYDKTNAQGVLRIYGGTIQGGTSTLPGSAVTVQASSNTVGGQLYMYGGTIIGGTASKGAALYIGANTSAQAFIYGGTIQGGTASEMGDAICLEIGKLHIYGGRMDDLALNMSKAGTALNIQGGTIGNVQLVDDFAAADPAVTISGKPVIEKLTRGGSKKPTIAFALEQGASVIFSGETLGQTFGTGSSVAGIGSEEGMVALCENGKLQWARYIIDEALKFAGASVSLYTDIAVNFKVENSILEGNFTDPYVVFDFAGTQQQAGLYELKDGYGVFRFRNIGPHMMGETITATLYANKDGVLCQGQTKAYSIAQYCYNTLARYNTDYYAELRTLLVDLLTYGAMAQRYVDSSTPADRLVTAALTEEQKAWGTPEDSDLGLEDIRSEVSLTGAAVTWKGGGLSLRESVALRLRFAAESIEGLSVQFTLEGKTYMVSEFTPVEGASGEYYVYLREMNASHMRSEVKATAYRDGQPVSGTVTYSVASYIANHENDSNTQLAQLVKAIIRYGDAAYSYVN